ncbi:uncharacterized protein [Apostichopus japonicus]|uniref:uncharacterized protein n=1 Tax=Stichopus japonicus TaxID=307972 RepID=UPI003AB579FF
MSIDTNCSARDYERLAKQKLCPKVWGYYSAGAGEGTTLQESKNALKRLGFRPQMMRTEFERDFSVNVLGHRIRAPIGVAPTAYHGLAHPDGEKATAKGVENFGAIMIVSNWASNSIEDIAASARGAHLWMQTFIMQNRQITINIIRRAEKLDFKAIVITIDVPICNPWKFGFCQDLLDLGYDMRVANIDENTDEVRAAKASGDVMLMNYMKNQTASCPKWNDIAWVKTITTLPVIVKGVLTAETAREAAAIGVDGIIVSAHGGRQLDEGPVPIDALPEVVDALKGQDIDVYVDGGFRTGSDVMKALAMGAKMVFLGRPAIWALAVKGADGVCNLLENLENDLDYTMALCGCNKVSDLGRSHLRYKSQLPCRL